MKNKIFAYIKEEYGILPDFLWANLPHAATFRHLDTKKWFAIWMSVKRSVLGLNGDGMVDILNVKCDALLVAGLIDGKGILPAYHMNKRHWITILLDGNVPFQQICDLVDLSYEMTKHKKI